MPTTIPHQAVSAAEVACLREQVLGLDQRVDDLTAAVADARATAGDAMAAVLMLLHRNTPGVATFDDPVSARAQARKRRIEASGLTVLPGGAR